MKKINMLIVVLLTILVAGCGTKDRSANADANNNDPAVLKYQGETSTVSLPELAEYLGYFKKVKLSYQGAYTGGPESIQYVATNQLDYGMSFNGAIIKSIEKGVDIQSVVSSYGNDPKSYVGYYKLKNSSIHNVKDLIGKKIAVNIRGAHYEMAIKEYLRKQGLTKDEIAKVEFVTMPLINAEQAVINKQVDLAALNGIFRDKAVEHNKVEPLFTDLDIFGEYSAGSYFFTTEFIKKYPEVVEDFTQGVARAIEWQRKTSREQVIAKMKEIINTRKRNETSDNLKYWRSSGVSENGGLIKEEDFRRWLQPLVETGDLKNTKIDVKEMYTNKFNPYE